MRKAVIILICFYSFIGFSQSKKALYISVNNKSILDTIGSQNDSIKLEVFRIKLHSNSIKHEFYINEIGILSKKIYSSERKVKILEFEYENLNNNNPPTLITNSQISNLLTYDDLLKAKSFENLINTIKTFYKLYLINNKCGSYYIAKRVKIKKIKSSL
tara:strand:+ start:730 stop:1206 length:477 start_codon:yes stop_codon:yes gene_type:complete